MSDPNIVTLAVHAPQLPITREEAQAQRDMVRRFGNSAVLPEMPEVKSEPVLPKLSDEIGERRRLREEIAAGDARIAQLKSELGME